MEIDFGVVCLSVIFLFVDFYSEIQIKNDGSFIERLVYLINVKSIFNIFKFAVLLSAILILFDLSSFEFLKNLLNSSIYILLLHGNWIRPS